MRNADCGMYRMRNEGPRSKIPPQTSWKTLQREWIETSCTLKVKVPKVTVRLAGLAGFETG